MHTNSDDSPRAQARAFAERAIAGSVVDRDRESRWDGALFRRLGDAGLLGGVLPREYGGAARPVAEFVESLIGLGEGSCDAGLALAWAAHTLGCEVPIWLVGNAEQRRRHLPALAAGERIGGWAHDEPPHVGDPLGVRTRATRHAGGWTLDGRKTRVVNGPHADVFVVTALTDPSQQRRGVSTFLVERGAPGLVVEPRLATSGARTAAISELVLDRCHVPEDSLLGAEGEGLTRTWRTVQRWERGCALAPWLGMLRAALALALRHAREHAPFGEPLARSQTVRARLADMKIRLELCERLQARSARQLDHLDASFDRDLATARLFLADGVAAIARDAASVCVPSTLESGHTLERLARDVPFAGMLGVGDDVLRSIVAGALLGLG